MEQYEKEEKLFIYTERESSSKKNVLHGPHHTASSRQSANLESPPVFLGSSLDLLWVLWSQLRLRSGLTAACSCFQSLQLVPKSTGSNSSWGFNLLYLWLQEEIPFFLDNRVPGAQL